MKRRDLLALLGGSLVMLPDIAGAQPAKKTAHVAILWHAANAEEEGPYFQAALEGLRDHGSVEGRCSRLRQD